MEKRDPNSELKGICYREREKGKHLTSSQHDRIHNARSATHYSTGHKHPNNHIQEKKAYVRETVSRQNKQRVLIAR